MQSKNVLLLGLLFVLLLTAFCVAKYIDQFYPNVKTISAPKTEVLEQNIELHPINIEQIMQRQNEQKAQNKQEIEEIDSEYVEVIKMVEQEEKDVEEAYHQALMLEDAKNRELEKKRKTKHKNIVKIKKEPIKKSHKKRVKIETVLKDKTIEGKGELTELEKEQLKELVSYKKLNPSSYLQIETKDKNKKVYKAKRFLTMLGILSKDIKIKHNHLKNSLISSLDKSKIEIFLIKTSE